jgi:cell division protease FtsH
MARKMVCDYGMSDNLGPMTFGKKEEQIFLGREISQHRDYSEETARKIDKEVSDIIASSYSKTHKLLEDHIQILHGMANALLEKETLEASDINRIIKDAGIEIDDDSEEDTES